MVFFYNGSTKCDQIRPFRLLRMAMPPSTGGGITLRSKRTIFCGAQKLVDGELLSVSNWMLLILKAPRLR
jgi:hypothetical protein